MSSTGLSIIFFFNDPPPTEIYTLSLHDALPISELGLTYEDLRSLNSLPDRVCVIGAADTGCQLTSILADFGCEVTLVEYAHRIVPGADVDEGDFAAEVR